MTHGSQRQATSCTAATFASRFLGNLDDNSDGEQDCSEVDIYGGLDEEMSRIQRADPEHGSQYRATDNNTESEAEDNNVEMVLFSYFCDHFA